MNSRNNLIAWLLAGGAAVGGVAGGGYYATRQSATAPAPISSVEGETSAKPAETAAVDPEKPAEADQPLQVAVIDPAMPRFDILRVEPDGSAVVAGSAKPDSTVELMSGGVVVATAKAGPGGDFAMVLDTPLAKGGHELTLRATDATGAAVVSEETGIVTIPDGEGELTAMVSKAGQASRILQKGEAPAAEVAAAAPNVAPAAEAPAPEPAPAPAKPVLVSAVDFEAGKIYVAGSGEAERAVNIYIDDVLAGTAKVGADGSFLLETATNLAPGTHKVRVDMLGADGSQVVARSEVPLLHEEAVAVVEPAKPADTTVAVTEPAKPAEQAKPAQAQVAAAEPAKPAAKPIKTGASVIIRRGDNLWRVSRRMLGKGVRYTVIYEANKDQIKDPQLIFPGQVLKVPQGSG